MRQDPSFRPTDPAFLANPYPTYARLRDEAPMLHFEPWDAFVVTRYRDVDRLLRDRRLGRVTDANPKRDRDPNHAPFDAIQAGSLLEIEPPDHTRIKQAVHDVFTPKHVRDLAVRIESLAGRQAHTLARAIAEDGQADLLTVFAEPIPVTVIAELLGVPEVDRPQLLPWSKAIIGMFEPERTAQDEANAVNAAAEFAEYVRHLMHVKRDDPQDDLITRMVTTHDREPGTLQESEIVANAILFLNAGHEAVVNVFGNGMKALLEHPDQHAKLKANLDLAGSTVEEMMRFDTPLQFFERFTHEDIAFEADDGQVVDLPAGTKLALYYASANHDERVFEDPTSFKIDRSPNKHIAFGLGLHYCIGAPLARLELTRGLQALEETLPNLALTDTPFRYAPKNVFRYLTELPVTVSA